jgi:hypothetical protein
MELEQRRRKVRKRGGVLTALQRDLPLQGITMAQDLGDAVLQVGDLLLGGELEAGSGGGPLLLHGGVVVSKGQGCDEDEHGHCQSEAAKKVDDRVWCRAGGHHVSCWAWLRSCG